MCEEEKTMLKERLPVAVLVSGGGTNLEALLRAEESGLITSAHIALVVADRNGCHAIERAQARGVATLTLPRRRLGPLAFEEALEEAVTAAGCRLIVLAGFLSILSPDFVSRHRDRIVNVHPSLIPAFCGDGFYGLRVHQAALERGVKVTGATVHLVNEITDGGRILAQKAVEVHEGDSPETLQRRVMEEAEWVLLPQVVEDLAQNISKKEIGE